jgi:hypothetical protein
MTREIALTALAALGFPPRRSTTRSTRRLASSHDGTRARRPGLPVTCLSAMTGHCPAAFRYSGTPDSADRAIARPAVGGPGRRRLMPGLSAQPVIHFAIGRRQVTMTDCNEQFVISSLQSAHIAEYALVG